MTKSEVLAYLKEHQDPRGIPHWTEEKEKRFGLMKSYGIGPKEVTKIVIGKATATEEKGRTSFQCWAVD